MLTVGDILKGEREKKNITLAQVEKHIKIREKYLIAIENNDWAFFNSKIYITGIIKNYAKFLDLDRDKMLAFFRRDYERLEEVRFKKRMPKKYLAPQTRKIVYFGIAAIFLFFFTYFGYQLKLYFIPPTIEILSPKVNKFNDESKIKIVGKTTKDSSISIFGERVYQNKQGIFEYDFPLHKGSNELQIEVVSASGKKRVVKKEFFRVK